MFKIGHISGGAHYDVIGSADAAVAVVDRVTVDPLGILGDLDLAVFDQGSQVVSGTHVGPTVGPHGRCQTMVGVVQVVVSDGLWNQ